MNSPRITALSWGRIRVEGVRGGFKDAKLFPGGSREWDWAETGTHHQPGIQPADVQELVANGAETIVLSRGHHGRLGVEPATIQFLKDKGIELFLEETPAAVERYNALAAEEKAVGALIHSTC